MEYQAVLSLAMSRGLPEDWYRLGCVLHDAKRYGSAAGCFARVVGGEPGNYRALTNLGWNLHLSGRSREAVGPLTEAIGICVGDGKPHALLSQVWGVLGCGESAVDEARFSVECEPHVALNHVALSFALMFEGRWEEGWREYEHRFSYKLPEFNSRPYRLWRGERAESLYLEAEQGLGDCLFALRWLPFACERAESVVLYVHGPVYPLVREQDLPGNVRCLPLPQALPEAEAWCPLMSLPVALEMPEPFWPGVYLR